MVAGHRALTAHHQEDVMRRVIIRGLVWAAAGFIALWALRLGYGYLEQPNGGYRSSTSTAATNGFENEKRNYASTKVQRGAPAAPIGAIDQKYERVADVRARARAFDDEEAALRKLAAEHGGVIQLEHKLGLRGERVLNLAVGVPPEEFDAFVAAARLVGIPTYLTIDKQDRTNEWKQLEAKRAVLEATRTSLASLKARSGSIEEMVALEDRILAVHQEIQSLGISLGEFDAVNELCTVKITLAEEVTTRVAVGPTIPVFRRLRIAFEWAVPFYLRLLGALLTAVLVALAGVVVAERFRPLQRALARAEVNPPRPPEA
jgi:hypothetical protein